MKNKAILIAIMLVISNFLVLGSFTLSTSADEPIICMTGTGTNVVGGSEQIVPPVNEYMSDVIAFDISKGQWTSDAPDFIADLQAAGYTIATVDITDEIPDNIEKIIVMGLKDNMHLSSPYTAAEGAILEDWVDTGGELMILSDHSVFTYDTQELCFPFSVTPTQNYVVDVTDYDTFTYWVIYQEDNFAENPLFNDVESVEFICGCSFGPASDVMIITDEDADPSQVAVAIAKPWGQGRVAIFGDTNWIQYYEDGYDKEDNVKLAMNTIYWLNEVHGFEVTKEIIDAEYEPQQYVPIFTKAWWDLEITVENTGFVDLDDIWVYDSIGAKLRFVIQDPDEIPGSGDEFIFTLDGTPVPLGDDDEFFGNYNDEIIWKQANKKYDPIKNPCATNIMWYIENLPIGDLITLEFRIYTIEFKAGPHTKQAFTSTCHHSLNDGAIAVDEYDEEYYYYWSDPVIVSVYYPFGDDPEADSDSDGLYDWEEVEGEYRYITDPCNYDTDGDGFGDYEEIFTYETDPTDPESYPLILTEAELLFSPDDNPYDWDSATDSTYSDYIVDLDDEYLFNYLDLGTVTTNQPLIDDDYNGFYLSNYPDGFFDYWNGRGVYDGCIGIWEPIMWEIINGNLPTFYIKYDESSDDYILIDGLQYKLFHDYGIGVEDNYLRIDGTYYLGSYEYEGVINGIYGPSQELTITIDFHGWQWCETVDVSALGTTAYSSTFFESGEEYKLVASGTAWADTPGTIEFDAEYSSTGGGAWIDGVQGYEYLGTELLDLKVNGGFVYWGTYNSAHIYKYEITGTGTPATFELQIYDSYPSNNQGNLVVNIYEWI